MRRDEENQNILKKISDLHKCTEQLCKEISTLQTKINNLEEVLYKGNSEQKSVKEEIATLESNIAHQRIRNNKNEEVIQKLFWAISIGVSGTFLMTILQLYVNVSNESSSKNTVQVVTTANLTNS